MTLTATAVMSTATRLLILQLRLRSQAANFFRMMPLQLKPACVDSFVSGFEGKRAELEDKHDEGMVGLVLLEVQSACGLHHPVDRSGATSCGQPNLL